MRICTRKFVASLAIWIFSCVAVHAAPANDPRMTAYEQGTFEAMQPWTSYVESNVKQFDIWFNAMIGHRKMNLGHDHSDAVRMYLKNLYEFSIIPSRRNISRPKLMEPESMRGWADAFRNLFRTGKKIFDLKESHQNVSNAQWDELIMACREVIKERDRFRMAVGQRVVNYTDTEMSYNLSLQLKPIPIKIDFIKGEVKITATQEFGPLSLSAAGGVSGSRSGVTTIVVVAHGEARVYATGGRTIEFYIPASHVKIDGPTMTITALGE